MSLPVPIVTVSHVTPRDLSFAALAQGFPFRPPFSVDRSPFSGRAFTRTREDWIRTIAFEGLAPWFKAARFSFPEKRSLFLWLSQRRCSRRHRTVLGFKGKCGRQLRDFPLPPARRRGRRPGGAGSRDGSCGGRHSRRSQRRVPRLRDKTWPRRSHAVDRSRRNARPPFTRPCTANGTVSARRTPL